MSEFFDKKLKELQQSLEGRIDFVGQERVEELTKQILWSTGALSFIVGLVLQSLKVSVGIFSLGFLGCCAVVLPSYPSYNAHPVAWLPKLDEYGEAVEGVAEPKKER
ncbi:microsomal signal peptidase 12 kDa subunit-domain-containing protein [Leucosporidium creatinivorum]|uniref:Signal peptidase complex subunit 1 n=1 Tax=Leucosporidium creatinivorum TaxID=106004 RepID=A0A1Y2DW59_9BASI|nr:microsomal signal peptidase 12 kDa subunit-domain-containing protein [Leucosporidium creatinivorum]